MSGAQRPAGARVALNELVRAPSARSFLVWSGLAVTGVFTYFALRDAHLDEVWRALRDSNYWWLLPALATLALAVFVRALRWRFLFAPETRPALGPVTSALLVGYFFNNVLPARAGEAARIVVLHQRTRASRAETLATVVIERTYDVVSLLVIFFVCLPWFPIVGWLRAVTTFAVVLAIALAAVVVALAVWGDRPLRFALRPFARLPFVSGERVDQLGPRMMQGLVGFRRPGLALAAFGWTTLSWVVTAFSFWLVMQAFGLDLSPLAGVLALVAVGLAMILPSAPAAVGVFEGATLIALSAYGVSHSLALSYALVLHAVNLVPFLVVGAIVLREHAGVVRRRAAAVGEKGVA